MTPKRTTATPLAPPEPAKVPSPAELAEELMDLADQARDYDDSQAVKQAETALAVAKANVAYNGEKQLRILRAKSIEEAKAILAENRADLNLMILCRKRSGWQPLREKGATDPQLRAFLGKRGNGWPEYRPHGGDKVPSAEVGYNENAKVWVDPEEGAADKDCLTGQKLIDAVRRVMGIPKPAAPGLAVPKKKPSPPQKPSPKPTPAKKPAAKPKAPPAPAKTPAPAADPEEDEDFDDIRGGADDVEASAARDTDESGGDPNVNAHGVFIRGVRSIRVTGMPKPAEATLYTALAVDGTWRSAHDVKWGAHRHESLSGVHLRGEPYDSEAGAIAAQLDYIETQYLKLIDRPGESAAAKAIYGKALAAVRLFAEKGKGAGSKPIFIPIPPAKPAPGPRKLTWGQWAATLWGIGDGQKVSADVPQRKDLTERERFFLTQFEIGKRPSEARDAWIKQAGVLMAAAINEAAGVKPGVLPSVAALAKPQTPMPTPEDESGDTAIAAR